MVKDIRLMSDMQLSMLKMALLNMQSRIEIEEAKRKLRKVEDFSKI